MNIRKVNIYIAFKLPAAWLCGVRLKEITQKHALTTVSYKWINQNPFQSMYFAVQSMAAELSTGSLVMQAIRESKKEISMLVLNHKGSFYKKAVGRITFTCEDGLKLEEVIQKTFNDNEPKTCWMKSIGRNERGEIVSEFDFEWTLKSKI
ncbi:DUF4442 domain-containing protein [Mesonia sp. K7]|uniref:DUF4442 domain-containing protein n=1 Tax=Mesonia sp. K7 TaxID=2218606 RepID=UPI000DA88664|nr:DUF4442 domain-containing protein [Mesonia sp. K7]PZD77296.1 thioesterase [Mesonia sp. K7]